MSQTDEIHSLRSLVLPDEIVAQGTPQYGEESLTWNAERIEKTHLLLRPKSVDHLSKIMAFLGKSNLDFAVRSLGFGNASAKDVLVSLKEFNDFEWDGEKKIATVGVGQSWVDVYRKMEKVASDYAVIACRTPSIGVGGSVLAAGFSWLSAEFGCTSDPISMLDAQVVKLDGSVIWASEEPDLLWALRGAGANFGVVTKIRLQAFKYPQRIWAGPILISQTHLPEIAKGISRMSDKCNTDPKVGLFVYLLKKEYLGIGDADEDMIVLHVFDALGEEHGRSDKAFGWALKLPGIIDHTEVKSLLGVSLMQEGLAAVKGKQVSEFSAVALTHLPEELVLKAFDWFFKTKRHEELKDATFMVFELFCTRDVIGRRSDTGWPRPHGIKHAVLFGTGCAPNASQESRKLARQRLIEGPAEVMGLDAHKSFIPNVFEAFHDPRMMFEDHYPKLMALKKRYDPKNQLKGNLRKENLEYGQVD